MRSIGRRRGRSSVGLAHVSDKHERASAEGQAECWVVSPYLGADEVAPELDGRGVALCNALDQHAGGPGNFH